MSLAREIIELFLSANGISGSVKTDQSQTEKRLFRPNLLWSNIARCSQQRNYKLILQCGMSNETLSRYHGL